MKWIKTSDHPQRYALIDKTNQELAEVENVDNNHWRWARLTSFSDSIAPAIGKADSRKQAMRQAEFEFLQTER